MLTETHRWLQHRYRVKFDCVALAHYRDGRDGQAFHRDRDMRYCEDTVIAILSFGPRRPWLLRPRTRADKWIAEHGGATVDLAPAGGDLLVMGGRCQVDWEHSVPQAGTGPDAAGSPRSGGGPRAGSARGRWLVPCRPQLLPLSRERPGVGYRRACRCAICPPTSTVDEVEEVLAADGGVVIDRLVDPAVFDAHRRRSSSRSWQPRPYGDDFSGHQTRRTGGLVARSRRRTSW